MRVLDLGCGSGQSLSAQGVTVDDEVVGVDIDERGLEVARNQYPRRTYLPGFAETLDFLDKNSFDLVVSNVAMPYMNIPVVLSEIHRVLRPGGRLWISLHTFSFTFSELTNCRFRPKALLYRFFVMGNGVCFHFTGRVLSIAGRCESTQTRRGIRIALKRAGFCDIQCVLVKQPQYKRLIVEAAKV